MPFTYEYSQPEEYHFSLDSVLLAEIAAKVIAAVYSTEEIQKLKVLDLCAGCGVIGFELSWHLRELRYFDFVEVQGVYESHFIRNVSIVGRPEVNFQYHLENYENLVGADWESKFDIVLCNPPYFQVGQGKLSPSEFKNRCRFFIDSTFQKLVECILRVLNSGGSAFLLLRPLKDHKINMLEELSRIVAGKALVECVADVRGTDLYRINRI